MWIIFFQIFVLWLSARRRMTLSRKRIALTASMIGGYIQPRGARARSRQGWMRARFDRGQYAQKSYGPDRRKTDAVAPHHKKIIDLAMTGGANPDTHKDCARRICI